MCKKPSYEELEHKVKELEKKAIKRTQNEKNWNVFFELSNNLLCIIGVDRKFKQVNSKWYKTLGWSKEELKDKSYTDFVHPEDLKEAVSAGKVSKVKGESLTGCQNRYRCKDGSYRWLLWDAIPFPGQQLTFVIARDITNGKRAEEELQQKTHDLGERVKELDCLYGIATLVENPDISLEEILQGVVNLIPSSWQYPEITCSRIILEGNEYKTENFKETRWKQSSEIFLTGKRKGVLEVFYLEERPEVYGDFFLKEERSLIDAITERLGHIVDRKRSEEALKVSEEKYRILVENANDAIFVTQDGIIKFPNRRTEELTGYSAEELTTLPFVELIHPQDRDTVIDRHKRKLRGEEPVSTYSLTIINKSSLERTVQLNTAQIQWKNRPATLNFLRDITQQAELESRLKQSQKMEAIGTLAGGIAHDFNNVLYAMIGFIKLAMDNIPESSLAQENLREVLKGARRAKDMVQQIITFSRKTPTEKKPFKVQSVVKEALKLLRASIPSTIEIRHNIDADCGPVLADPTQIHQVVMNLATNAYQAMREKGGMLELTLMEEEVGLNDSDLDFDPGTYLKLTVIDTGHGMGNVVMEKIFDPYFSTKGPGGTGMGLSVVYGIIKDHGGKIEVSSELAVGTVFHIYLPLIETSPVESKTVSAEPVIGGAERILFVDDEEHIVLMTQQTLERLGYRATSRTSSVEALEVFKAKPDEYDLVITNMTMPKMTGVELAHSLKKIRPNIPVIICTEHSPQINEEKAKNLGLATYVMKPIVNQDIATIIRSVLDERKEKQFTKRILIIDDDAQVLAMLRETLEREGYEVVTAPDGQKGLRLYRKNPTDLSIIDLIMPEKEGLETIIELRRDFPDARIIAISGGMQDVPGTSLSTAKILGAQYTFEKPVSQPELLNAIRELLK